jgi:hypothetical protein
MDCGAIFCPILDGMEIFIWLNLNLSASTEKTDEDRLIERLYIEEQMAMNIPENRIDDRVLNLL